MRACDIARQHIVENTFAGGSAESSPDFRKPPLNARELQSVDPAGLSR
jgi:hypothetical protein